VSAQPNSEPKPVADLQRRAAAYPADYPFEHAPGAVVVVPDDVVHGAPSIRPVLSVPLDE
jgi:hypothetical protein